MRFHYGQLVHRVALQGLDQIVQESFPAAKVSESGLDGASHLGGGFMRHCKVSGAPVLELSYTLG